MDSVSQEHPLFGSVPKGDASPDMQLLDLITGSWIAQIVYTTARLELADKIQQGVNTLGSLARELDVGEDELLRLLGAVEALGIIGTSQAGVIEITPMGQLLRSDRNGSLHSFALFCARQWHTRTWEYLPERLKLDRPAFDHIMGMPLFDYLKETPTDRALFDGAMDSLSSLWGPAVVEKMDLSGAESIIDVGGGSGLFLAAILSQNPTLKGCVFDLPEAIEQARQAPHLLDLIASGRCTFAEGSFFDGFPTGADTHVMKFIIHDWPDEQALAILKNSRQTLSEDGQLLIVEQVVSPAGGSYFTRLSDIEMLLFGNGRERSADEFAHLLEQAGFKIANIRKTSKPFSIIRAVPA